MLPWLADQTVVRLRGTSGDDTHWNDSTDWDTADSLSIAGCSVQGQLGTETVAGRDSVTWVFTLFAPPDADVTAYDRITVDGATYEVDGPVVPMHDPSGLLGHKQAQLRLVEG